ncbi:MAG: STAS domain-containing protein [Actinobacteria bacterium]|nr:STAS domain-containing protein [Actinomycetota bacterium]
MPISILWDPHRSVASVAGTLEVSTVEEFRTYMDSLSAGPPGRLHVDLGGVTFLDSSGLRELVRLKRRLDGAGSTLSVGGASAQVRRLFEQTGLDGAIDLRDAPLGIDADPAPS